MDALVEHFNFALDLRSKTHGTNHQGLYIPLMSSEIINHYLTSPDQGPDYPNFKKSMKFMERIYTFFTSIMIRIDNAQFYQKIVEDFQESKIFENFDKTIATVALSIGISHPDIQAANNTSVNLLTSIQKFRVAFRVMAQIKEAALKQKESKNLSK